MLGNWLGKRDYHHYLSAAARFLCPMILDSVQRAWIRFSCLYRRHMLNALQTLFTGKLNYFAPWEIPTPNGNSNACPFFRPHTSFWTFDDEVMAPCMASRRYMIISAVLGVFSDGSPHPHY